MLAVLVVLVLMLVLMVAFDVISTILSNSLLRCLFFNIFSFTPSPSPFPWYANTPQLQGDQADLVMDMLSFMQEVGAVRECRF